MRLFSIIESLNSNFFSQIYLPQLSYNCLNVVRLDDFCSDLKQILLLGGTLGVFFQIILLCWTIFAAVYNFFHQF